MALLLGGVSEACHLFVICSGSGLELGFGLGLGLGLEQGGVQRVVLLLLLLLAAGRAHAYMVKGHGIGGFGGG